MKHFYLLLFSLFVQAAWGQSSAYSSYFTGDTSDVVTNVEGGICLMGGATENDSAMVWFLRQSGGGDILVIRASGSNGYNQYLYSDLGVSVNSVETIVFNDASASNNAYILKRIQQAEAIWIAGGDQSVYKQYWKDSPVEAAINQRISAGVPVGGTSAGMAILGRAYFDAMNGSVTSATALSNPFDPQVSLGYNDFLIHPLTKGVITDTHYDNPDRKGRQTVFLARLYQQYQKRFYGIACEEYTAVCVDAAGNARIYGDYPSYQDFAYFLVTNCEGSVEPETCVAGSPLTWNQNQAAVKVYKVAGTMAGSNTFNLNDWKTGTGGQWEDWYVNMGVLSTSPSAAAHNCVVTSIETPNKLIFSVFPNPTSDFIKIRVPQIGGLLEVFDLSGRKLQSIVIQETETTLQVEAWQKALYLFRYSHKDQTASVKVNVE